MKTKQAMLSSSLAVILLSTPIQVLSKQWVTNLNAISEGSCESFGNGWSAFADDGKSNMQFCKEVTDSKPTKGVIDIKGHHPGKVDCTKRNGEGWVAFAYDRKADITFCMKMGDVNISEDYVADVDAFVAQNDKVACDGDHFVGKGRGWNRVIYNGFSKIMFCARFK